MDVIELYVYFTVSAICLFFSIVIVAAQAVLKVNAIFTRIGLYLFVSSLVASMYAFLRIPGWESYSREMLIIQRMISLLGGFPLISLIAFLKKGFLKTWHIALIYASLAVLFVIALIDLVGHYNWLFLDPPPRANLAPLFKIVYIPFSFIALGGSFLMLFVVSRQLTADIKRLANTLVIGMAVVVIAGLWDYITLAVGDGPFHDQVYLFNPAIIILAVMIFLFIIQFIRLHMKYKGGGRNAARRKEPAGEDPDRNLFDRLSALIVAQRLYADATITIEKAAAAVGRSRSDVSRAVNKNFTGNFSAFINTHRVEEMKRRLADPDLRESILGIGEKAGFNSKTSMNRTFRQFTGISPKEYRERMLAGDSPDVRAPFPA